MYHKVSQTSVDFLTVTHSQLAEHLSYLIDKNYHFISASELLAYLQKHTKLPPKPVLLTFDDAYLSFQEYALPVLQRFQAKATLFVPTDYVGKTSAWDINAAPILAAQQLQNLPPSLVELGLHSHQHQNYKHLNTQEIEHDLKQCIAAFNNMSLPFVPIFAYPYGGRPKNSQVLKEMKAVFVQYDIMAACRIGNRVNSLKLKDPYEINRLDIRGNESFEVFKRKVRWGKWW